jgi:hypothetical protein
MFRYLPILLLVGALAIVAVPNTDDAEAVAVPNYVTTGGWFDQPPGQLFDPDSKVRFGGVLQCDAPFDQPNNLIVHYTGTLQNVPGEFKGDNARFTINGPAQGCAFAVFATNLQGGQITLHAD